MNPDEWLAQNMAALLRTAEFEQRGGTPPTCHREMMVVAAMRKIATGDIRLSDTREYAADALDGWQSRLPVAEQRGGDD